MNPQGARRVCLKAFAVLELLTLFVVIGIIPFPYPVGSVNPWRYVSTKPFQNPKSFDLWAEVVIGNQLKVIGNWKQ